MRLREVITGFNLKNPKKVLDFAMKITKITNVKGHDPGDVSLYSRSCGKIDRNLTS